jgi:DNA-binding MarR family transcriptional regulator
MSYKDIAGRLGLDPTTVRRLVDRYGAQLAISVQTGRTDPEQPS